MPHPDPVMEQCMQSVAAALAGMAKENDKLSKSFLNQSTVRFSILFYSPEVYGERSLDGMAAQCIVDLVDDLAKENNLAQEDIVGAVELYIWNAYGGVEEDAFWRSLSSYSADLTVLPGSSVDRAKCKFANVVSEIEKTAQKSAIAEFQKTNASVDVIKADYSAIFGHLTTRKDPNYSYWLKKDPVSDKMYNAILVAANKSGVRPECLAESMADKFAGLLDRPFTKDYKPPRNTQELQFYLLNLRFREEDLLSALKFTLSEERFTEFWKSGDFSPTPDEKQEFYEEVRHRYYGGSIKAVLTELPEPSVDTTKFLEASDQASELLKNTLTPERLSEYNTSLAKKRPFTWTPSERELLNENIGKAIQENKLDPEEFLKQAYTSDTFEKFVLQDLMRDDRADKIIDGRMNLGRDSIDSFIEKGKKAEEEAAKSADKNRAIDETDRKLSEIKDAGARTAGTLMGGHGTEGQLTTTGVKGTMALMAFAIKRHFKVGKEQIPEERIRDLRKGIEALAESNHPDAKRIATFKGRETEYLHPHALKMFDKDILKVVADTEEVGKTLNTRQKLIDEKPGLQMPYTIEKHFGKEIRAIDATLRAMEMKSPFTEEALKAVAPIEIEKMLYGNPELRKLAGTEKELIEFMVPAQEKTMDETAQQTSKDQTERQKDKEPSQDQPKQSKPEPEKESADPKTEQGQKGQSERQGEDKNRNEKQAQDPEQKQNQGKLAQEHTQDAPKAQNSAGTKQQDQKKGQRGQQGAQKTATDMARNAQESISKKQNIRQHSPQPQQIGERSWRSFGSTAPNLNR